MKENTVNKVSTVSFLKWTKRFVVFAISVYILQMLVLETDVKNKITIFVTHTDILFNGGLASKGKTIMYIQRICEEETKSSNSTSKSDRVFVDISGVDMKTVENALTDTVAPGGRYFPPNCTSKQKVAIVIPFRDRDKHLRLFLRHMHPFLQRQQLEYRIFVIELVRTVKFNRAMLMNIGFVEALKLDNFDCFVFHDVDLLPENNRIPYSCAHMPRHLSVAVDKFKYKLPYQDILGGICALSTEHFKKVNGMSNMFFGWGGEDDDFRTRVYANKLVVVRPSVKVARYTMIKHVRDHVKNQERVCLLKSTKTRMRKDGLSNLKYRVRQLKLLPLYTLVLVSINQTEQLRADEELYDIHKQCLNSTETMKLNIAKKAQPSSNKTA